MAGGGCADKLRRHGEVICQEGESVKGIRHRRGGNMWIPCLSMVPVHVGKIVIEEELTPWEVSKLLRRTKRGVSQELVRTRIKVIKVTLLIQMITSYLLHRSKTIATTRD